MCVRACACVCVHEKFACVEHGIVNSKISRISYIFRLCDHVTFSLTFLHVYY